MFKRIGEWVSNLDWGNVLSGALRAAYIGSMGFAFVAFFTHVAADSADLTWIVGILLASALGLHEFMQTVRTTRITAAFFRSLTKRQDRVSLLLHSLFNGAILCTLLAFDVFMLWNYVSTKDTGTSPVPVLTLDTIQAFVIPILGLVASFMIDVEDNASDVLRNAVVQMLNSTTRTAVRQWKRRIKKAARDGVNLTPIVASLMVESGDSDGAKKVALVEQGLAVAENGGKSAKLYLPAGRVVSGSKASRLTPTFDTEFDGRNDGQSGAQKGRKKRRPVTLSKEQKIVAFLTNNPDATANEVMLGCRVSRNTAVKHINKFRYEQSFESDGTEG